MDKLTIYQISQKFKSINAWPAWIQRLGNWSSQMKTIRDALGMSQQQLAKRCESSQIAISRLEQGEVNPTLETLSKIAHAMGCDLLVSFVPKKEIYLTIEEKIHAKAEELLNISIANAAMEIQKPQQKTIEITKEELTNKLIKKRGLLWS